ncbi:hypothetical protein MPSEU_000656600 [Mayamaea pseudoterrestris]|nr:hypothetical protein MPSEU_000656600 [Mayamaea pseudoterrestris]
MPKKKKNCRNSKLLLKTAEANLEERIKSLEQEIQAQKDALQSLREKGEIPTALPFASNNIECQKQSLSVRSIRARKKQGYLWKWMDRSIGWGGTKWALRFVSLDGGRLSYTGNHNDNAPRYVLSLRGCAVRDEGWKRNRRHWSANKKQDPPLTEPGAYFFIFSVYQRAVSAETSYEKEDEDVVPLLRFSTPSMAENQQWMQLISEACAYSMTDDFLEDEAKRAEETNRQQRQLARMAMAMPEAKEGTLPPLYFATVPKMPTRRPSTNRLPDAKSFQTKSKHSDVDQAEARSTKSYPPSKPMHRCAASSYLSVDAPAQNYRGFFNLAMILLAVSNFRLICVTIQAHGFVLTREQWKDLRYIREKPWDDTNAFVSGFVLQLAFLMTAFGIEWGLAQNRVNEWIGMILHYINAHCAFFVPLCIVWHLIDSPTIGAALLLHATITWMKLVSYAAANEDYRLSCRTKEGARSLKASLALVESLDAADENIVYPQNVTMRNIFYFWFAPTLTYQIAFPRSQNVRWLKVVGILVRMVIAVAIFTFLVAQVVSPALANLVLDLEQTNGTYNLQMMGEYWLKLSVANTYLWLLMFYVYFHLYLNLFAELLRFGDRVFYKDWWNSSEVSAYWRLWNCPVHYWLIRHLYFPCMRMKISRSASTFLVFFVSAVLHEILVSVPFHMIRPWSFIGMMMQVPLVAITKYLYRRYPGTSVGNLIFWLSFCVVGQPMAVFLYAVDYQYGRRQASLEHLENLTESCRVVWQAHCLIR